MNRKLASTILFSCVIFGISHILFSQTSVPPDLIWERDADGGHKFFNFKEISVLIEGLPENLKIAGLTGQQIQTDAEIRLQKAGLLVNESAKQYIYVNLNSIDTDIYTLTYSIKVSLRQEVFLVRDKDAFTTASTWDRGSIGTISKNNVRVIRDSISDYVDEFINKYLKYQNERKNQKVPQISGIIKPVQTTQEMADELFGSADSTKTKSGDQKNKQNDSPFTATYVGGNAPPEVEIFNDSDRTMYIDLGQGKLTAYTILSKQSISLKLLNGNYNYKASAARVSPLQGINEFRTGYRYTWRFTILKR
jgi:hypothetical protein